MDANTNFETAFLTALREACKQLQLEELLSANEQQILIQHLGIGWFQASGYDDARQALEACQTGFATLPIHYVAICKSLAILMDECYPAIALSRLPQDDPMIKALPTYSAKNLLERLRHHYLIAISHQNRLQEKFMPNPDTSSGFDMAETPAEKKQKHCKIYLRNYRNSLLLLLKENGLESRHIDPLLNRDRDLIIDDCNINQAERDLLQSIMAAAYTVKHQLTAKYERISKTVPLNGLAAMAPEAQEIAQLIKGNLQKPQPLKQGPVSKSSNLDSIDTFLEMENANA